MKDTPISRFTSYAVSSERTEQRGVGAHAVTGLLTVLQVVLETCGRRFRLGRETYAEQG
jgi:hypothetical protein